MEEHQDKPEGELEKKANAFQGLYRKSVDSLRAIKTRYEEVFEETRGSYRRFAPLVSWTAGGALIIATYATPLTITGVALGEIGALGYAFLKK